MISDCCKIGHQKHRIFFCLKKVFEKVFEKLSGRSNVFISKRQSSLSNKFYDINQTLQAEAISNIVRID